MLKKISLLFLIASIALSACGTLEVTVEQTPTPGLAPTPTKQPLSIDSNSSTPVSVPTLAELSSRTRGPYLAYLRELAGQKQLVLMDSDGVGRRIFALSPEYRGNVSHVSHDGKWLAFYSGSAGECGPASGEPSSGNDLTLNLLDLNTSQAQVVTPLLSSDYPRNFEKNVADLLAQGIVKDNNDGHLLNQLKSAFLCGIRSLAWSPDSRYLAFAGEMDGPSSDVYLYDTTTRKIQRMTDGLEEVQEIHWSLDGKWIEHLSSVWSGEGMTSTAYAAALDGSVVKPLLCPVSPLAVGVNDHTFFAASSGNGVGSYGLRLVNIETCASTQVWEGAFHQFEFDPAKGVLAITPWTQKSPVQLKKNVENFNEGLYLINIQTGQQTRVLDGHWIISPFGVGNRSFFVKDNSEGGKRYFLSADGTLTPAGSEIDTVSVAPDQQHWISIGKTLKIFGADDSLLQEVALPFDTKKIFHLTWTPNSSGLFFISDAQIYALHIPGGKIELVEANSTFNQEWTFGWVAQQ